MNTRNLILAVLFVALAMPAAAKRSKFHLGITTGLNSVLLTSNDYLEQDGPILGPQLTIKALANLRKWQFGGGIEMGALWGGVQKNRVWTNGSSFSQTVVDEDFERITAPYIAPHIRINHKIKFPRKVYLYIGGMGGMMIATNTVGSNNASLGWMAGLNFGGVLKLSKRISLDVSEGWRITEIYDVESDIYNRTNTLPTSSFATVPYVQPYNVLMNYFNFNIGLRFKL